VDRSDSRSGDRTCPIGNSPTFIAIILAAKRYKGCRMRIREVGIPAHALRISMSVKTLSVNTHGAAACRDGGEVCASAGKRPRVAWLILRCRRGAFSYPTLIVTRHDQVGALFD
jgi:hypothetical protein